MKILHSELAQKGDEFSKGDRVAVDAERGKGHHASKSWWLGTVLGLEGTKLVIEHDDDGEADKYPYSRSQTEHFIKLPRSTQRIGKDLTRKQVESLLPAVKPKSAPQVKSLPPKVVRPATKPADVGWIEKGVQNKTLEDSLSYPVSETAYNSCPWLGVEKTLSSGGAGLIVGLAFFPRHVCVAYAPRGKTTLLFSGTKFGYGQAQQLIDQVTADQSVSKKSKMLYADFLKARNTASETLRLACTPPEKRPAKQGSPDKRSATESIKKFKRGQEALVGKEWLEIRGIDEDTKLLGLVTRNGSLSWVKFDRVKDVRDAPK